MKIQQLGFNQTVLATSSWGKEIAIEQTCICDIYLLSGTPQSGHMYVEMHIHNGDVKDIGLYTKDGTLLDFDGVPFLPPSLVDHLIHIGINCDKLKQTT